MLDSRNILQMSGSGMRALAIVVIEADPLVAQDLCETFRDHLPAATVRVFDTPMAAMTEPDDFAHVAAVFLRARQSEIQNSGLPDRLKGLPVVWLVDDHPDHAAFAPHWLLVDVPFTSAMIADALRRLRLV